MSLLFFYFKSLSFANPIIICSELLGKTAPVVTTVEVDLYHENFIQSDSTGRIIKMTSSHLVFSRHDSDISKILTIPLINPVTNTKRLVQDIDTNDDFFVTVSRFKQGHSVITEIWSTTNEELLFSSDSLPHMNFSLSDHFLTGTHDERIITFDTKNFSQGAIIDLKIPKLPFGRAEYHINENSIIFFPIHNSFYNSIALPIKIKLNKEYQPIEFISGVNTSLYSQNRATVHRDNFHDLYEFLILLTGDGFIPEGKEPTTEEIKELLKEVIKDSESFSNEILKYNIERFQINNNFIYAYGSHIIPFEKNSLGGPATQSFISIYNLTTMHLEKTLLLPKKNSNYTDINRISFYKDRYLALATLEGGLGVTNKQINDGKIQIFDLKKLNLEQPLIGVDLPEEKIFSMNFLNSGQILFSTSARKTRLWTPFVVINHQ